MDIGAWLRELGLERYMEAFQENAIDAEVLPELTDADLEKLGVLLGHRKKLLKAIAELRTGESAPASLPKAVEVPSETRRATGAERRQLTVMFVDLVESTELAARLDPEDMGQVVRAYQECCAEAVKRWDGHVAKFIGDGVLTYFGWPRAHEEDAERAVRAGLAIVDAVARLATPAGAPLMARVGIATGLVMVGQLAGEGVAREETVVGETPNLASRLQALAAPGSVVISQSTYRLVGSLFEFADLGAHPLRGFAAAVQAWRVLGENRARSRFEARHGQRLTPLVGREHELGLLLDRWRQAKDGDAQVVLLAGEPGVGKSRILLALRERLTNEPHTRLRYFCSPYHMNTAFYPILDQIERGARIAPGDSPEVQLDKLEALFALSGKDAADATAMTASLLSIPTGKRYPPLTLSSEARKAKVQELWFQQIVSLAARCPVLMLLEDVHWIDPTSLEQFDLVIERIQRLPVFIVITLRPDVQPPWTRYPHVTSLSLNRLSHRQSVTMVERVTGGKGLPSEILEQIVQKADGVPLFLEELTKAVLESGLLTETDAGYELAGPLPPFAIPATLQDSLMARLDRLAPVKEVAQVASVIGREFPRELLAAVTAMPDSELETALGQLAAAELVFRRGLPPNVAYAFKHALLQDAAYASLLRGKRQQLHARIAAALRERFPQTVEAEPELMARHCAEAGLAKEAIHYLTKAGRQALERSANAEAVGHLRKGLVLLETLPAGRERDAVELDLLIALGPPLIATSGFTDPEVEKTYVRARALCQELENTTQLVPVLVGLANIHLLRAELRQARELGEECLMLAQQNDDPGVRMTAHRVLGSTLHFLGEFPEARAQLEQANAVRERYHRRFDATLYLISGSRVYCRSIFARVLWALGYPDQALSSSNEALRLAEKTSHSHTRAQALSLAAAFHLDRRDVQRTESLAREAVTLATQHDFPYWRATGSLWWGWTLVQRREFEEGLARIQQSLAHLRVTDNVQTIPHALIVLADVYGQIGDPGKGLAALAEALVVLEGTNERRREAEIHRLRGELLLSLPGRPWGEAEACFERALAVARGQSARMWELRTATSLARLWAEQGKGTQARDLLAPVHGWFTEGFDTADLKDAKALLDELS